jgi:hypothetical protein
MEAKEATTHLMGNISLLGQAMSNYLELRDLWNIFRKMQFPKVGGELGNLVLFDSLLAGIVSRFLQGDPVSVSDVPQLDTETINELGKLKGSDPDAEYARTYVDTLIRLRGRLIEELR